MPAEGASASVAGRYPRDLRKNGRGAGRGLRGFAGDGSRAILPVVRALPAAFYV